MTVKHKATSWDAILTELCASGAVPQAIHRVLLWGPPRTGKSSVAAQIFGHDRVERVTLHRQQPVDDLTGGYCLRDGTTVWADGPAVRAMKEGKVLVLDEIDQHSPETRCILHAIMDDPPGVTLASGERVEAVYGFVVIATTNALPGTLPAAILDRFDLILKPADRPLAARPAGRDRARGHRLPADPRGADPAERLADPAVRQPADIPDRDRGAEMTLYHAARKAAETIVCTGIVFKALVLIILHYL